MPITIEPMTSTQREWGHVPFRVRIEIYDSSKDAWLESGWGYQVEGMSLRRALLLFRQLEELTYLFVKHTWKRRPTRYI
jgi:hypothetical protein